MVAPPGTKGSAQRKTWYKLQTDTACCFQSILEAAPHKTATAWPLVSYLTNHSSKTNTTCWSLVEIQGRNHKRSSPTHKLTGVNWPVKTHQICADTGCRVEALPLAMDYRDGWGKKMKGICTINATWRYIYIYIYICMCVCVSEWASERVYACISVCVCVCVFSDLSIYIYVYACVRIFILHLSKVSLSLSLSLSLYICICVGISTLTMSTPTKNKFEM